MVGASSLEEEVSRPLEVVGVVEVPFLAWVVEVLSWPSGVGVVPSWPSVVEVEVEVEVGSSPWLTPHANTDSL
jgi:hypothetical protein